MLSTSLFSALDSIQDGSLYDEVFGLLEAARNFSRDCAPSDQFDSTFELQLIAHLQSYSQEAILWFSEHGIGTS